MNILETKATLQAIIDLLHPDLFDTEDEAVADMIELTSPVLSKIAIMLSQLTEHIESIEDRLEKLEEKA
jgi:predicted ATP-grasp superfamily ATP-dependent carboligase